jgi:hypothetical protein
METLEQLRQQLTNDLKNSFLKRASDTDSNRKPLDVIGEVSLMLATNIADYSEKLLREIVTPGYVTDEYDKRYTLLTTFNAHESNLRDAKHITKEQLDVINLVTSWFGFDPDENAVYVKNKYNFYAEGGVSAKGFSAGGSGGGGGMDEELLWSILGDGDNPNKQIALSHLDTLLKNISNTYYTKQQIQANYLTASEISAKYISKDAFPKIFSDEMAKWFKKDEDGNIYAEVNFYSTQGISAKGLGSGSGGGGGMDEELLWAILGDGENPDKQIAISHLSTALSNYATHTWVTDKHYATEAWVTAKKYATIDWVNETFVKKADYTDLWLTEMDKWFKKDDSGNIYTEVNFYSNKGVSAKGLDASGGGGGGMDEELLWSILGDGENPNKQIALTHLTTALSGYYTSTQVNSAINDAVKYYIPISQKGVAGGVAPLGSDGLISSSFLPSYVDDVLEFASLSAFPSTGESGKIYIAVDTNLTYRWSGTQYVEVSKSLALGETENTAYAGNKGAANRADIDKLKRATFWGASYQSDGNVYGTFTGTKIILSDLIETPKIKIGDAFIEYDAERTALKVVRYLADGTETVASLYATGGISARGFSPSGGGGGGGAGSISLNGTLYESVDGVITLPNLKLAEPTTFKLNAAGNVEVRTPGRTGYYEFWDSGSEWAQLSAKAFAVVGGTASQFLKADGSVDGTLYALAYNGNQNKVLESNVSNSLHVIDRRDDTILPSNLEYRTISTFFKAGGNMPDGNWWSGIQVNGWGEGYCAWELAGPSSTNNTAYNLRYRTGIGDTWGDWKMIMTDVECDKNYVKKAGDTMTGSLYISVDAINPPSLAAPSKLQFAAANGSQPVALVYTDFDAYRPSAGIRLMGNQDEEWFEASWILGRKLNMSRVATEYSAGTGAVINYFGTDTIMDNQSSSVTGTMKIRLPVSWTNTMGVYKIMLYEYNGRGSSEITVSFYNYSSSQSYYNYSYQLNGAFEGAVRVAHDGSGCCILLGNTSYNWNYIKVYVYQVFNGQSVPINYVNQPYNISIITSEAGLSKVTSIPKTSMNRHDDNYIRAINKNGYYGMGKVGNIDTDWIRTAKPGLIPFEPGSSSDNSFLGTETWQFGKIFGAIIYGQRVCSLNHNLYLGSSGNSGWVYCQDICSANGTAEAYWSIRTNGAAVFTNLTSKNKITGDISGSAAYLPTAYIGGTQANPQTYFNQNMGLRVAMTGIGWSGQWGDTLWINGYAVDDVLPMCALHFIRNGTPRFGISTQNSNGTSYGTNYEVWTAYNSNKAGVNWSAETFFAGSGVKSRNICIEVDNSGVSGNCGSEINNWNSHLYLQHQSSNNIIMCNAGGKVVIGGISSDFRLNVSGDIIAAGWLRTSGAVGWYSQSYGGGIYMTDSDMVQVYNNKVFYNSGYRQWGIGGHYCGLKLYNTSHIGINLANAKYTWGIYSNNNGNMYIGRRDGDVNNSTGSYMIELSYSTLQMNGNLVASGGVTAKSTSDLRLKNVFLESTDYQKKLLSLGRVFDFEYNHIAKSRKEKNADNCTHIGLAYQNVKDIMPTICGLDKDGYGYINYISPDFISLIAGAVQLNILGLYKVENKTQQLERRIKDLEAEISMLKQRGLGN